LQPQPHAELGIALIWHRKRFHKLVFRESPPHLLQLRAFGGIEAKELENKIPGSQLIEPLRRSVGDLGGLSGIRGRISASDEGVITDVFRGEVVLSEKVERFIQRAEAPAAIGGDISIFKWHP
jgi:hypothetical protein